MKILDLIETDFVNYKKTCMTVMFPYCTFKCNQDAGRIVCQNYESRNSKLIDISSNEIVQRYLNNPMVEALVMQGLEPFDSFADMCELVGRFSVWCTSDIVIYTGYKEFEIENQIEMLCRFIHNYNTLIIKFGRYIPDRPTVFDELLGVTLQSDNQYAKIVFGSKGGK